jgi:predicted Zn-dependent peptidase
MGVTFQQATLVNGLTILAEVEPEALSAAAGFFVKTGARDETREVMGVSHFLEHMMFKGTAPPPPRPARSASDLNRDFDRIGARNNAYTTAEMTCFHAAVLPERLLSEGGAVELLADMMRPALRDEDFDTEKNVILEEIAMYEDNPFWVLYERVMEEHYGDHPLAHRVLGTSASISGLKVGQMREYFRRRYSPDNTVVALAGRLDFDAAVRRIEGLCAGWERTGATRAPGRAEHRERVLEIRDEKVSRAYLLMVWPGPSMQDPRRYAATLAAQVLGGPDNSRLHWSLIETGMAEEAEAGADPRDGAGDVMVSVSCDPARLDEVAAVVDREVERLAATVTEDDLDKIRSRIATGVTVGAERPGGRMQRLGRQWVYLGAYTTLEEELARINAVTVADVKAVLEAFPPRPRTVGRLVPARTES